MNDELFDKLMRDKLNSLQPEFNEQVWNDLELKLNQHYRQSGKQIFLKRLLRVAAILLGAGVLYGISDTLVSSDVLLSTYSKSKEQQQISPKEESETSPQTQREKLLTKQTNEEQTTESNLSILKITTDEVKDLQKTPFNTQNSISTTASNLKASTTLPLQKRYSNVLLVNEENLLGADKEIAQFSKETLSTTSVDLKQIAEIATLKYLPIKLQPTQAPAPLLALKIEEEPLVHSYFKRKAGLRIGIGASAEVSKNAGSSKINGVWNGVASILLEKNIQKKWRFGFGLNYLQKFQNNHTNPTPTVATQLVEVSAQTRVNQLTIEKERGTFTERLEVPVELKLMIGNHHRWRAFVASGIVVGLNLKEKDIYESENVFINSDTGERIGSSNVFRKTDSRFSRNLDWQVNAGLEYSLNSHFHIQLMPYYKYALSNTQAEQTGSQIFGFRSVLCYSW